MEKINIEQDFGEFKKNYERNKTQIISVKLINHKETITSAYLKVAENSKNSFLFESLEDGEEKGRFSIIGLNPDKILKLKDKTIIDEENDRETIISEGNVNQKIRNFISENTFEFSDKFPSVASSNPAIIFNCVDLPAPLTPTKPILSPLLISQLTSFKTSPVG